MLEVGSGSSTRVSANALVLNEQECGWKGELTIIEPEPHRVPRDEAGAYRFPGLTQVHEKWLEEVPLALFLELEANDVFVIDSSHRLMQRVRPKFEKPIYTDVGSYESRKIRLDLGALSY